jgi:hypothetical protein
MVAHACDPSAQEAEVEGSQVQGQPGLHSETVKEKKCAYSLILHTSLKEIATPTF